MTTDTWLRTRRAGAGFLTAKDLADVIGAKGADVRAWERGDYKPPWKFIEPTAGVIRVQVNDVLAALWGETIGDPCPCGIDVCRKAAPSEPMARALRSARPCRQCGAVTVYAADVAKRDHADRCDQCSKATPRSDRIVQRCVGYDDHGARRRATTCQKSRTLTAPHLRRNIDQPAAERVYWGKRAVIIYPDRLLPALSLRPGADRDDLTAWEWTCPRCRLAAMAAAVKEAQINDPAAEPVRAPIRIRSRNHRRALLADRALGAGDGLARELTPAFFDAHDKAVERAAESRRGGLSPEGYARRLRSLIVHHWSGDPLPRVIVFECRGCHGIAFCEERMMGEHRGKLARTAEWHRACHPGRTVPERGKAAHRPARKDRRRDFGWALQVRGSGGRISTREIARRQGVDHTTVLDGIAKIDALIDAAAPALIPARFRPHVEIIISGRS